MTENGSPITTQDVLDKLNEGAEALQNAQESLSKDVTGALARLAAHETDPNAHGGSGGNTGGEVSTAAIATAINAHNNDMTAHGLNTSDSPISKAIQEAVTKVVNEAVSGEDDAQKTSPIMTAITNAITEHDENKEAHSTLLQNIIVGSTSPIVGICRVSTGGGCGLWFNIDAEGNPLSLNGSYFDRHPVYSGIQRVIADDQIMGKIPQFWLKDFIPESGMFAGKPCKLISPGQQDGFRIHPAFLNNNVQIPYYLLGCYAATDEGGTPKKLGSRPGKAPFVNVNFDTMKSYCVNRNVDGVSGFMLWDVYQWAALTTLMLIEKGTPDMQSAIGRGHVDGSAAVTVDATIQPDYRGFRGLWGNVWHMLDGVRADANKKTEIFKNDGSRAWVSTDFAMTPYSSGMTGWIVTMKTGQGDGYNFDDVFLPETLSGSETGGSYADGFWGPIANGVCYPGGDWSYGSACGPFYLNFTNASSHANTSLGGRLAKI